MKKLYRASVTYEFVVYTKPENAHRTAEKFARRAFQDTPLADMNINVKDYTPVSAEEDECLAYVSDKMVEMLWEESR